jgi:hypothetical protein
LRNRRVPPPNAFKQVKSHRRPRLQGSSVESKAPCAWRNSRPASARAAVLETPASQISKSCGGTSMPTQHHATVPSITEATPGRTADSGSSWSVVLHHIGEVHSHQ